MARPDYFVFDSEAGAWKFLDLLMRKGFHDYAASDYNPVRVRGDWGVPLVETYAYHAEDMVQLANKAGLDLLYVPRCVERARERAVDEMDAAMVRSWKERNGRVGTQDVVYRLARLVLGGLSPYALDVMGAAHRTTVFGHRATWEPGERQVTLVGTHTPRDGVQATLVETRPGSLEVRASYEVDHVQYECDPRGFRSTGDVKKDAVLFLRAAVEAFLEDDPSW